MRTFLLLAVPIFCLALGLAAQDSRHTKNATAGGRYYGENEGENYKNGENYGSPKPTLIDQYLCDLEATILVVASKNVEEGGYDRKDADGGSYNNKYDERPAAAPNAVRLKCSHIATRSDEDCQQCCELAARLDHSVSRRDVSGFIINADQIDFNDYKKREKRQLPYGPPPSAPNTYNNAPAAAGYHHQPPPPPPPPQAAYQQQQHPQPPPPPTAGYQPSQHAAHEYQKHSAAQTSNSYGYPGPSGSYAAMPATASSATARNDYASPPAADTYSSSFTYEFFGVPKNRRCVCCAPKIYDNSPPGSDSADESRRQQDSRRYRQRTSYRGN